MHIVYLVDMCLWLAMEMSSCQREMASIEEELEKRHREVYQLQTSLQEAEKIIVSCCHSAYEPTGIISAGTGSVQRSAETGCH